MSSCVVQCPPENLVLQSAGMECPREMFLSQWREKFPGIDAPKVDFASVEEAEESLNNCKSVIKSLEAKLNQEKLHLIFLQTYLASTKRSYSLKRWGFRKRTSSSASENNPSTVLESAEDSNTNTHLQTAAVPGAENVQQDENVATTKPAVKMRPKKTEKINSVKRKSKVLASVMLFEGNGDAIETTVEPEAETTTQNNISSKSSFRKRSSYLEVWECKTGADTEQTATKDEASSEKQADSAVAVMASDGAAQQSSQREPRKDYVEVWTCKTGDQVSVGVVYDDQHETLDSVPPTKRGADGDNAPQDFGSEDIDAKDSYAKKHYTIAGSDVKLRSSSFSKDPPKPRGTWPAAIQQYQDGENSGQLADQVDDSSTSIDLSDLENDDHLSDSPHTDSSQEDGVDSVQERNEDNAALKPRSDTSPLRRLRRAQTTTERMSVAFSAFQDWSDEDRSTADRTSMLSGQSLDIASSDDEVHLNEADANYPVSTAKANSSSSAPVSADSGSKDADVEAYSSDSRATSNTKPAASATDILDGSIPVTSGSTKKREAVSDMVDYQKVRSIAEAEKLRMRRWVLTSLLDTEEAYIQYLNTLLLYMKPLKATIGTSQPVMSAQDFDTLFYRVPEIHSLHTGFYSKLKPRLEEWSADTAVGDLFKKLLSKLNFYGDYVNNYKRAQHTVEKCAKENLQFRHLIESLKVQSRGTKDSESISLIEVLYKPVERVMRTTLVLQDLLKHTPHRHPDYQILRQVLKQSQSFLERINSSHSSSFKPRKVPSSAAAAARSADREMITDGFLVEVAGDGSRKLRHCFLYSDLLLCAKQKSAAGVFHNKDTYECKWYIPLADLSFKPKEDSDVIPDAPATSEEELREMSDRVQQLKRDIARERKRSVKRQKSSDNLHGRTRTEERLRKKLAEQEARIVLAAPDLPLRIYHMQGKERPKSYMFLMSSDYERTEWSEAIMKLQETCFKSFSLTTFEINHLLANCIRHRKVNNIGSMLMKEDEELFSGYLVVTIHSGQGFLRACNPYCTLEVDSYGQFQTKAKTRPCHDTKEPVWNEEFELDLDGAMTLRILCYDRAREASAGASYDDDVLIAKGKVSLLQESLRQGEWIEESVLMNELTIRVSVKFIAREKSVRRRLSKTANGLFGVKIEIASKRDSSGIPGIVRKCIAEIERRGMNEVGIYRVSGVASEIQALKASFDSDRKDVNVLLGEVDVNAVAGVLKLYFRELPEPLFTDARYSNFVEASSLSDPETKLRTITGLLSDLPVANYKTLHYLRNHLIKVANNEHVNKMSYHNLATVFGPTLLRPAEEKTDPAGQTLSVNMMMLNTLRLDVHYQMDILLYCLELEEMLDYETLKGNTNNNEKFNKKSISRKSDSFTTEEVNNTANGDITKTTSHESAPTTTSVCTRADPQTPKEAPLPMVVPPASNYPRYHHYEEVFIPPRASVSKNETVKPQLGQKPPPKPKPAPRKGQKLPIVTDL